MSMIRGKIESDREIAPKEISYGESPFTRKGDQWVSDRPDTTVVTTNLGKLLEEAGYDTSFPETGLKKSADSRR